MLPGDRFYFMTHAYHHFVAEVVAVLGPQRVQAKNIRRIQSSQRDWTWFFREGAGKGSETVFTKFPPGIITFFNAFEWHHEIPGGED